MFALIKKPVFPHKLLQNLDKVFELVRDPDNQFSTMLLVSVMMRDFTSLGKSLRQFYDLVSKFDYEENYNYT